MFVLAHLKTSLIRPTAMVRFTYSGVAYGTSDPEPYPQQIQDPLIH